MKRVRPHTIGLAVGAVFAIWHTIWSLLVATRLAQPALDFVFQLHMITPPYKVAEFQWATAIGLVLVTGVIGYVAGLVVGLVWNHCDSRASTI